MKKYSCLILFLLIVLCMSSCGQREEDAPQKSKERKATLASTAIPTVDAAETPLPTQIPKEAKKTIEECLRGLLDKTPEDLQVEYRKEGTPKYDKLSDWKDAEGNFRYPQGYKIQYLPSDYVVMAEQQMPQAVLKKISTEELYALIMSLPGDWSTHTTETYLDLVSRYYVVYNFMTEFIRRKDSAEVVHRFYQKYSQAEQNKYTMDWRAENYQKGYEDTEEELRRAERFQITEGLEWFFRYKAGKQIPNEECLGLGCAGHY